MSHVYDGPLATYNSLTDPNLSGFFGNTRMKRHLKKAGLVSQQGLIVSENQYRLNMARKEHKKHVRNLLAQAIVHKTLDLERYRQVEIRHKLEEIAKIEMVRRVRASRGRKGDEEILPYLTPRSHSRSQSERPMEKSSMYKRPKSAPAPPRGRHIKQQHDIAQTLTDRNTVSPPPSSDGHTGQPISPSPSLDRHSEHRMSLSSSSDRQSRHRAPSPLSSGRSSFKDTLKHLQPDSIDTRHLYALDSEALHQFALHQSQIKRGHDGASSPYLISQSPILPRQKRAKSACSPKRTSKRMSAKPKVSSKRGNNYTGALMLHRQEKEMMHQGEVQTLCEITMKYHGPKLRLPRDHVDPTQQVIIEQQHCGGNTLPVFMERLKPGSTFSFISRRHRGFPFSLTIYIDSRVDCRVSTCCEYKHAVGVKLGGSMGHFSLAGISGATPCYKCKLNAQAQPRSLQVRKAAVQQKNELTTLEKVIVDGTQRSSVTEKKTKEHKGSDESGEDTYEDDFEKDNVHEKKHDAKYGKSNKQYIVGLKEDETRINGKTVQVDVTEKDDKDMDDSVPYNRNIEGYSSEDEDLEEPRQNSIAVTANVHDHKEVRGRTRSSSSSSLTSSSSSSEDKSKKWKSLEQQKTASSTKPQDASKVRSAGSNTLLSESTNFGTTSTSSRSLTTESEMKHNTPRSEEKVARKRLSFNSSSSTVTSNSDDEKYKRKVRDEKSKQGNENKTNKDSDVKKSINEKFEDRMKMETKKEAEELDRTKRFEQEEQKGKTWAEERKKQFDLLKQQSEERFQNRKEERKQSEMNRDSEFAKKKAEEDQRKAEERRKRLEEEERIKRDYVKQLSMIQSQRDSDTFASVATSTASDEAKPLPKADTSSKMETPHYKPMFSLTINNVEDAERRTSVPAFTNMSAVENVNNVAPVKDKRLEIKSSSRETDSDNDSSSDSSSTSCSDNEQKERKSPIMQVIKTVSASDVKPTRKSLSTSSTSTISSSSGGDYMTNKDIKLQQTPTEVIRDSADASKSQINDSAAEIGGPVSTNTQSSPPSSSVSDSDTSSEKENHFLTIVGQTDNKHKELSQTDTKKVLIQNDSTDKPSTLQSPSASSSHSSTDTNDDEYHSVRMQAPPSNEAQRKDAMTKAQDIIEEKKKSASGTVSESASAQQTSKDIVPGVLYPEVQELTNINISESPNKESEQPIDLASNHQQVKPARFGGLQREKPLEVIERNQLPPSQEPKQDESEDSEDSSFDSSDSSESSESWDSEQDEDNKTDTVGSQQTASEPLFAYKTKTLE